MSSTVASLPVSSVSSMSSLDSEPSLASDSHSELEELQVELSNLKEDTRYVDFVEAIHTGKDLSEPDSEDPLYSEGEGETETSSEGTITQKGDSVQANEGGDVDQDDQDDQEEESGFQENEDEDSSDDDSDATLEDIEEDDDSAAPSKVGAPIPPRMKVEANKRFPPFWKTHMKLQAAEGEGEEGDADYCPPEANGDNSALREKAESGTDSDSSDSEDEEDDDMVAEDAGPIDDQSDLTNALQSGIEEMQLVEEEVKQEQAKKEQEGNILSAITSFDDSTYDESADADFAPPADVDAVIEAAEELDEKILTGEQEEPITDNDSKEVKSEENEEMET